jgi:type VI secretion system secreted protein VgrG
MVITGNMAISPGSAVTGFPPGRVTGVVDNRNGAAIKAQTDLVTAYNDAAGATPFVDKSGVDLGGQTLSPGVYRFSSSAQLTGTLTLDGQGDTNATFIFQIGSALTTASASRVVLINGANACGVFWQVTSSATLGTGTSFQGTLIALSSITLTTAATIGVGGGINGGRALARNGAVTLDTNTIIPPAACTLSHATAFPGLSGLPGLPDTGGVSRPDGFPWMPLALAVLISGILVTSTVWRRRRRA